MAPKQTILVTLANGKQGRTTLPVLLANPNLQIRAFVHSSSGADALKADFSHANNLETFVGDLMLASDLDKAMQGVDTVFHISPPMTVHEPHMGVLVIEAAEKAGVKHFIFSSVLHPIRSKLLNHDVKRQIEEFLIESSLNWTILQPTHFLQNTDPAEAAKNGVLPVTYNPENEMGFLDLRDMAEVIQRILSEPEKHYRARYELCGENLSYVDYAALIAKASGKQVKVNKIDGGAVAKKASGGDRDKEDRFHRMFFYYDRWGLVGNKNILEWLLGKPCRTIEGYIKDALDGTLKSSQS